MSVHINDYQFYNPINKTIYIMSLRFEIVYRLNRYYYKSKDLCKIIFSRTLVYKVKHYRSVIINNRKILFNKLINFWKNN